MKPCAKILPTILASSKEKFEKVQKQVELSTVDEKEGRHLIIEILGVFLAEILQ
jgi:hypothetical protein